MGSGASPLRHAAFFLPGDAHAGDRTGSCGAASKRRDTQCGARPVPPVCRAGRGSTSSWQRVRIDFLEIVRLFQCSIFPRIGFLWDFPLFVEESGKRGIWG
eukprot:1553496-Prymnesium_polylepis.1